MVEAEKPKKKGVPSASEETASPYPKMDLCQKIHILSTCKEPPTELQAQVFEQIAVELENPALYRKLQETFFEGRTATIAACKLTPQELDTMQKTLDDKLKELEQKVVDAQESAGDMEVMDARVEIARFSAKSLSEEQALEAYQKVLDLPKISSGKKIDALMESARVASFYGNTAKTDEFIEKADKLANEGGGGDWDRRNRLKVYKALQRMLHRDMEQASTLLLDCIATFSCNEICTYTEFIVYAILSNLLHLPRPEMKKSIIDGPEILSVSKEIPAVVRSAPIVSFFR